MKLRLYSYRAHTENIEYFLNKISICPGLQKTFFHDLLLRAFEQIESHSLRVTTLDHPFIVSHENLTIREEKRWPLNVQSDWSIWRASKTFPEVARHLWVTGVQLLGDYIVRPIGVSREQVDFSVPVSKTNQNKIIWYKEGWVRYLFLE